MSDELTPSAPHLEKLVAMIREATGNVISAARFPFLEEVAQRRARARGFAAAEEYVEALARKALDGEWENLIPLVTIKESYFFRAPQQFELIREHVLPRLMQARARQRHLRVWSAACARGEEPATLAILLNEEPALEGWDWTIVATDVDEGALAGAKLGLYGDRAVGQVPPHLLERYFRRKGKLFEFDPELRSRILFRHLNLAQAPIELPFTQCDLILLRNVLIYFRRPLQRRVIDQVSRILSPDGFLFLGASETLWQIQDELEAVDLGSCFTYRHRTEPAPPRAQLLEPLRGLVKETPPPVPAPAAPAPAPVRPPPPPAPEPAPSLSPILSPVNAPCGVLELLARAARDLAENRIAEAARAIAQVMETDPSDPAAHALEGFLHDLSGRTDEAVASYRAALYLDAQLFQARLLLADSLQRLGHRDLARHQYREVLTVLESGRERSLGLFGDLPLPDRDRAQRRAREVLKRG